MLRLIAAVAWGMAISGCQGQVRQPQPPVAHTLAGDVALTGRVVDAADLLPAVEEKALSERLIKLESDTSDQFVVVTLKSLQGQPIDKVATALANGWGIGQADIDNGTVLLVAPNERQVRISVGYGLEGLLTDEKSAEIVQHMLPLFRSGQPIDAIKVGASQIESVLRSDLKRPQYRAQKQAA